MNDLDVVLLNLSYKIDWILSEKYTSDSNNTFINDTVPSKLY